MKNLCKDRFLRNPLMRSLLLLRETCQEDVDILWLLTYGSVSEIIIVTKMKSSVNC